MEWYEELDFEQNPFSLDPLESEFTLVGRDKEAKDMLYMIASGNMLVIEGEHGAGKTALLKYAIDNFKGEGKVLYLDGNKISKNINIGKLLKKKDMILLMDNVQKLSKKNNQVIKYLYDEDRIKSVVFTTTDFKQVSFTDAIKERIGKNIIKLYDIEEQDAIDIVKSRLSDKDTILPGDVLKELYKKTLNIKEFIIGCDNLCKYVVNEGREMADKKDVEKVSVGLESKPTNSDFCSECGLELIKVGEYWRCDNCEEYCEKCGASVEDDDVECPECSADFGGDDR